MNLKEKVALVIRSGDEIGTAVALRLATDGARVAVCDNSLSTSQRVKEEIKEKNGQAYAFSADVCRRDQVETLVHNVSKKLGRIDILVNNIGIPKGEEFLNLSYDAWKTVLMDHFDRCFHASQLVSRRMVEANYGKIVHIVSDMKIPLMPYAETIHYRTACSGIIEFTKTLSHNLGRYGITANCIMAENIDTKTLRKLVKPEGLYRDDLIKIALALVPLGRLGTPEDVANAAAFLASEQSAFISGQVIAVKGGA